MYVWKDGPIRSGYWRRAVPGRRPTTGQWRMHDGPITVPSTVPSSRRLLVWSDVAVLVCRRFGLSPFWPQTLTITYRTTAQYMYSWYDIVKICTDYRSALHPIYHATRPIRYSVTLKPNLLHKVKEYRNTVIWNSAWNPMSFVLPMNQLNVPVYTVNSMGWSLDWWRLPVRHSIYRPYIYATQPRARSLIVIKLRL